MLSHGEWNSSYKNACDSASWPIPNKKERRKLYRKYMKEQKMNTPCTTSTNTVAVIPTSDWVNNYSFGMVNLAPSHNHSLSGWAVNKQEGNNPMNYATATVQAGTTETQDQRRYLSDRLEMIYWEKLRPLEAKFGLTDDDRPETPKELKKRIEEGKFVIKGIKDTDDEDEDDEYPYFGSWTNMIRWRDPAVKSDMDGYDAARKELGDLRQKTLDIIKIDEPKSGLDAIKALEAWEPTGAAN